METKEKVVYDANSLDVPLKTPPKTDPAAKKADDPEEEEEEPEEEAPEENEKKPKAKTKSDTEDEESDEEDQDDSKKKDVKADADEDAEEEEEETDEEINELIESKFGEKYEIKNVDELEETLDALDAIVTKNEELEKQLEAAKKAPKEPAFESEAHKKAFEFIKDAPKEMHGERLLTWAELNAIDIDNSDTKFVLRQEFIIKHSELTREEASRKFDRKYTQKYVVDPEKFEGDESALKEEEDDRKIDLKTDAARARKFLKETQQEFKSNPKDKEEAPKINESVKDGVAQNTRSAESFMKQFKEIKIEDGDVKMSFKLNDEKLKEIRGGLMAWIKNPANYTEKGELIGFDPEKSALQFALALYPEEILKEALRQSKTQTAVKKIEEVTGTKPSRKAKGGDATNTPKSEESMWDELIKQKELKKKQRQAA